ncbi:MAG: hypothetical protein NZT92_06765 [Abditibacteriales bacterium]|nr:hypothetical protein [Abditibacteriales bacterium]
MKRSPEISPTFKPYENVAVLACWDSGYLLLIASDGAVTARKYVGQPIRQAVQYADGTVLVLGSSLFVCRMGKLNVPLKRRFLTPFRCLPRLDLNPHLLTALPSGCSIDLALSCSCCLHWPIVPRWQPSEKIMWYEGGDFRFGPTFWGLRDGYREACLLHWAIRQLKAVKMQAIVYEKADALLHLGEVSSEIDRWRSIVNLHSPLTTNQLRRELLKAVSMIQKGPS